MAVTTVTTAMSGAINYTVVTDTSADWPSVANSTYFYDKVTKLVYFKNSGGTVLEIFSAGGLTYFTEAQNTAAPNATVPVDSLTALSATTNADAAIVPKGAGAFLLQVPDNTITGGNKRGSNAIDLQRSRTFAIQVASGNNSAIIGGFDNRASGDSSLAGGVGNTASGSLSVAIGQNNSSSNTNSSSFGNENLSNGLNSVAIGRFNNASGTSSVAIGGNISNYNTASGTRSVSIGEANTASGTNAVAIGQSNISSAQGSLAVNIGNTASGGFSFAGGNGSSATGAYGFSFGYFTTAGGAYSYAIGRSASATNESYAFGWAVTASGQYSTALGASTVASGQYSTAMGLSSSTLGIYGRQAYASGQEGTLGDSQSSKFILRERTTNNTATTLTTNSSAASTTNQVILSNQSAYRFKGTIIAKVSGTTGASAWDIDGLIVRGANAASTTLLVGNVNVVADPIVVDGPPTLAADTTNGGLRVQVIGALANIQWTAVIETTEVIYA
jgi:hypothetical protein